MQRQIERLIDAYTAGGRTLEERGARRRTLEVRVDGVRREEQQLTASVRHDTQIQQVTVDMERFREQVAGRMVPADFATKRAMVELVVDRVVVDAPDVDIRDVIPFTGVT